MSKYKINKIFKIKKNKKKINLINIFKNKKKIKNIRNHSKDKKKDKNNNLIIRKRYNIYIVFTIFIFIFLCFNLFNLMVINKSKYIDIINVYNSREKTGKTSTRGRIYDRNYNILVDNKLSRNLVYKNINSISSVEMINLVKKLTEYISVESNNVDIRYLREYYCTLNTDYCNSLVSQEEYKDYKSGKITISEYENLKINRVSEDIVNNLSDIEKNYAYIYYLMRNGYSYDNKVIKEDLSDEEYAIVIENENELVGFSVENDWKRVYPYGDTLKTLLGNVSDIQEEYLEEYLENGYSVDDRVGVSYLEKQYEKYLKGNKDVYKISSSTNLDLIEEGSRGEDIVLTIDINLQLQLDEIIKDEVLKTKTETNTEYYDHSSVILQDPNNGDILALSSKKYDNGEIIDNSASIFTETVTPGSIVKGASMLVGYNTNSVKIGEYMIDECIKVAGVSEKCSYKTLGKINDITALAKSSNVYQFKIAIRVNGQNYYRNMKMHFNQAAFDTYRDMYHQFGLGVKTEVDLPIESSGYTSVDTRAGNLLDFVIGQYETYTPIQISQYISTIANGGNRLAPHFLKEVRKSSTTSDLGEIDFTYETKVLNKVDTKEEYLKRVQEGFYAVMHSSGGYGVGYIDNKMNAAGKTGTSQSFIDTDNDGVIDTETITSSFVGYFPQNNPKVSITVISPNSSRPTNKTTYSSLVTYRITQRVSELYYNMYGV